MGETSLRVCLSRGEDALFQTTGCMHGIPVTYLLSRGSGAAQNLPSMDASSFLQNWFLGRYLRVTLFTWQRGTLWASSRLPTSWCFGLQGRVRDVRESIQSTCRCKPYAELLKHWGNLRYYWEGFT